MTTLAQAVAALEPVDGDAWRGEVPDNWRQGRTAFGGFSAAMALHAAKASDTDLPPLRSAQVAFVGPLSGAITVTARRLRRGRNAAFVQADVSGDAGLGLRATFAFMGPLPSAVRHEAGSAPAFPVPAADAVPLPSPPGVAFARNFAFVEARRLAAGQAEWLRWCRLLDRDDLDPEVELIAVADALPPGALRIVGRPAPVSSMTWLINLLSPPVTRDGWWLLHTASDHVRDGFSSQAMRIWNASGTPIAEHTQGMAIFA